MGKAFASIMGVGSSGSDCRIRVQTTASCCGTMAVVVSVAEKAGTTRQVCTGKTNGSEPLMRCRNRRNVAETGLQLLARDGARRVPADRPGGDRHKDGVRPVSGSCVERGNLCSDAKGDLRAADPRGAEYQCGAQGRTGS